MGTRADFYVGQGEDATWFGSIAWDGYPSGLPDKVLTATTVEDYTDAVMEMSIARNDFTTPDMGWPWPWDTSCGTDYAYSFADGKVMASCFGSGWFDPLDEPDPDVDIPSENPAWFPLYGGSYKNINWGERSGLIVLGRR